VSVTGTTVRIAEAPIDADMELARFRRRYDAAGAVASFVGHVRADRGAATRLVLEHYAGFTERAIGRFVSEAVRRWSIEGALVIHRVGEMSPGEAIVVVAAAAPHRRDVFEAVDFLMDFLKSEAPFWKREFDGTAWRWIEPTARDYKDKARWSAEERECLE